MKTKIKEKILTIITTIIPVLSVVVLTTSATALSDLSVLKGTGSSKIGQVFTLRYTDNLKGNASAYCIQKDEGFSGETKYVLKDYVEINGKEAKVYTSTSSQPTSVVKNNLNAEVAYILNRNQGYGSHENPTDAQEALWKISNSWSTSIFGDSRYNWSANDKAQGNSINTEAENYANLVGDQQATENDTTDVIIPMIDRTNKSNITVSNVGDHYRIGPFRWEFGGTLQSVTVGGVDNSQVRLVKYTGTTANVVSAQQILTGEAFYVDIPLSATKFESLTLRTSTGTTSEPTTVYRAKIWFLQAARKSQNIIYVDVNKTTVNPSNTESKTTYDIPLTVSVGLIKVDDRDTSKPLNGVGFKFRAVVKRYLYDHDEPYYTDDDKDGIKETYHQNPIYTWQWVTRWIDNDLNWNAENENDARTFYTDSSGKIQVSGVESAIIQDGTLKAKEVSNPYYGYTVGGEYDINSVNEEKRLTNHQKLIKLSGYVWLDQNDGKTTVRNNLYDTSSESGVNGITVYLKDNNGNTIKTTTTSEMGLYSEINGGEYQFTDVDLDQLSNYHIEFEYCGIIYQSVDANLNATNGSKAIDTSTRNELDNKFTSVDGNGSQNINVNGVNISYNNVDNHSSLYNSCSGDNVYAKTNEAGYNIYNSFTPVTEEIRNINLGLYKKAQADYALAQDLYDTKISVNGFNHVYRYATNRFTQNGQNIDEESSWNVGVKFRNDRLGTYKRAIYKSDITYESPNHRNNELEVYVTYKIALNNQSTYLGRINNIVDYCDNRYNLVAAGYSIDENDQITDNIGFSEKQQYNSSYSKYIINTNATVSAGETKYVYVQFKMDRNAVLQIMNNGETLRNITEINSYTTFKNNNVNTPVAVYDTDSVPGNVIPGDINTYEDDTDSAGALQLELKNERTISGTVFVDSTGKLSDKVYSGEQRLGNGQLENGETPLQGIKVTLSETDKQDSSFNNERITMDTTTDANGNYEFTGFIPGNYTVTYEWGDKTYKVQYYKGTIYDESRKQNDGYWYRGSEKGNDTISVNTRKTDALDSYSVRETIDNEMKNLKINTLESEIEKAYDQGSEYIKTTKMISSTPVMSFSVEYDTTVTDGNGDEVKFAVNNVDFGIVERAKQQLELTKRISALKITLANEQVLIDTKIDENGKFTNPNKYVIHMPATDSYKGLVRVELDTELTEGATVEITYEIKATNIGEVDYTSNRYYYYGNPGGADYVRTSVTQLIDYVDNELSVTDDKWSQQDTNILKTYNLSEKDDTEYLKDIRPYITTQLQAQLAPGESNTVELKTSKLLTTTNNITYDNKAEIAEITKNDGFNGGTPVKVIETHFDTADSEIFTIIPSTGENKNYILPIIIGITAFIILGTGIVVIKKKVIDNK